MLLRTLSLLTEVVTRLTHWERAAVVLSAGPRQQQADQVGRRQAAPAWQPAGRSMF